MSSVPPYSSRIAAVSRIRIASVTPSPSRTGMRNEPSALAISVCDPLICACSCATYSICWRNAKASASPPNSAFDAKLSSTLISCTSRVLAATIVSARPMPLAASTITPPRCRPRISLDSRLGVTPRRSAVFRVSSSVISPRLASSICPEYALLIASIVDNVRSSSGIFASPAAPTALKSDNKPSSSITPVRFISAMNSSLVMRL